MTAGRRGRRHTGPRRASAPPTHTGTGEPVDLSADAAATGTASAAPESVATGTAPTAPDPMAARPVSAAPDAAIAPPEGRGDTGVEQTRDDTDAGWGEVGDDAERARWLREQRPPHWG